VRRFFLESALHWAGEYQIDALRLDALHALVDLSPKPFFAELAAIAHRARERGPRKFYLMAESDLNDVRLVRPPELGGYGLDALWIDCFDACLNDLRLYHLPDDSLRSKTFPAHLPASLQSTSIT
jgi:maltooligosyltrehalose trehalohydrolase